MSEKDSATDSPRRTDDTQPPADAAGESVIDSPQVEEKVADVREALRALMRERRTSQREVENRCQWTRGYLSQVLQGRITLTLFHVLAVLRAVGEPWPQFFQRHFPTQEPLDLDEIRSRLDRYDGLFDELREQGLIEGDHSTGQARPEL